VRKAGEQVGLVVVSAVDQYEVLDVVDAAGIRRLKCPASGVAPRGSQQ
jgi:hypothetical protein